MIEEKSFKTFRPNGLQWFVITQRIVDILRRDLKGTSRYIWVTDEKIIVADGKSSPFQEPLIKMEKPMFRLPLEHDKKFGFVLTYVTFPVILNICKDPSLPGRLLKKEPYYYLKCSRTGTLEIAGEGNDHNVRVNEVLNCTDLALPVDSMYFLKCLKAIMQVGKSSRGILDHERTFCFLNRNRRSYYDERLPSGSITRAN